MDAFAQLDPDEREGYFVEAAAQLGLTPPVVEKDFWVCWTLKRLFALNCVAGNLLFKGGTSLSKVYDLIQRFSEDIDLSIHRASLGFGGDSDPANPHHSGKARKRQYEALGEASRVKIDEEIQPELESAIADAQVSVKVMEARRTFWEKATILHQMAHLPEHREFPPRYSRHYCDLATMVDANIVDPQSKDEDDLLAAVVAHKLTFYRSAWASYPTAVRGTIRLSPQESRVSDLRRDLQSMSEMFLDRPPGLEAVLESLQNWEIQFNQHPSR